MTVDIEAVRAAHPLSSIIGRSVKLQRAGREFKACCPFHEDRSPSFFVNDEKDFYHCFGCGAHGDVLDFVQAVEGVGLVEAAERLGAGIVSAVAARPRLEPETERATIERARAIWQAAGPAAGTACEAYLNGRGIRSPIPASIRFARLPYGRRSEALPALVALVQSATREPCGIQRTYLKGDGSGKADVPAPKLSLGRIRGGAIRLAAPASELVVSEGLEDSLSVQQELLRPTWAAAGASMLPGMVFPGLVRSVVIAADGDEAGERAARKAADTFAERGLGVRIMRPEPGFKDFNDQLREVRA